MLLELLIIVCCHALSVICLNQELLGQSFIYGISFLTKEDANSSRCYQHLSILYDSIEYRRPWALKVLDASGGPGWGFFNGNNLWLGSRAQCDDIANRRPFEISYEVVKHPKPTPFDYPPFNLGFFTALIEHNSTMQHHTQMPLEFTIQLGLCAPKSCSSEDLSRLLIKYINGSYLTVQNLYNLKLNLTMIRRLENSGLFLLTLPKTIILLVMVSVFIILSITGTWYDVKKHNKEKNLIVGQKINNLSKQSVNGTISNTDPTANKNKVLVSTVELVLNTASEQKVSTAGEILKCFSLYTNIKNLVNTKLPPGSIGVIHGLKFFAMLWVIMVHSVFYQADYLVDVPAAFRISEEFSAQILSNSTYCVDTFFFLSGFLVSYLFFKSKRKSADSTDKQINYARKVSEFFMMFLNRFLRLTLPYILVIIFSDVMYTYYRKTSVLYSSEHNDVNCPNYWWRNILYINNLYPRSEMCLSWSWYLSADTQFFVVTIFLLILSTIVFKVAAVLTVLLIIGSILAASYSSYRIKYIPTMDEQLVELDAIYDVPWNRIGPYLIGTITAYMFFVKMQCKLVLKKKIRIILWTLFPLLNLWILFTLYTRNLSVEFSAVYMGISRTLWGIGIAWVLIACCTGNARLLEKFLSFPAWIPLSRLTYCAYLINPILANMIYMGSDHSFSSSKAAFGLASQGIAMGTYFLAFFLSIMVETPGILLTKMFFTKMMKPKSINNNNNNNDV